MFGFGSYGDTTQLDGGAFGRERTWKDYATEVENGLPDSERERMAEAYENLRYSQGYFDDLAASRGGGKVLARTNNWDAYKPGGEDTRYDSAPFEIGVPVMKRVVSTLTENLYRRSPTRQLRDKQLGDLCQSLYKHNGMAAKWQRADAFTVIGGFSAFQFAGDEDPRNPIKINLWSADQLCPWTDPDDPTKVKALATIDQIDGRTRATLWTEEKVVTFLTRRDQYTASRNRKFERVSEKDNPYRLPDTADEAGRGIIPFSFAHFEEPATEFSTASPGTNLRNLNGYLNWGFDDLADGIRYLSKPIGIATGVDVSWAAPAAIRPGMFLNLAAGDIDAGGNGPQPNLSYLSAENSFAAVIWSHLNNYLDLSLEMENIPPSAIRMILDARSGVSILAEKAPLLGWTEHRRRAFAGYERSAIVRMLEVMSAHLRAHGHDSKRIDESAIDPGLSHRWPRLYVDLPGPERDRADGNRLTWGMCSLIDLVQEREDCTREQALETLSQVKKDNDELAALGIEPIPAVLLGNKGGGGSGQFGQLPAPDAQPLDNIASKGNESGITGEPVDANAKADALSGEGG